MSAAVSAARARWFPPSEARGSGADPCSSVRTEDREGAKDHRPAPTARSRKSVYSQRRERPLGHPSSGCDPPLASRWTLGPLTSKLSTAASWLLHSIWHPYSCRVLLDGALCPLSLSIYKNHYIPSVYVGR